MRRAAASRVLTPGDWLKMCRVHTSRIGTEMIEHESIWDHSAMQLIRDAVGEAAPVRTREDSIPLVVQVSRPQPTGFGLVHLRPKAFSQRNAWAPKQSSIFERIRVAVQMVPLRIVNFAEAAHLRALPAFNALSDAGLKDRKGELRSLFLVKRMACCTKALVVHLAPPAGKLSVLASVRRLVVAAINRTSGNLGLHRVTSGVIGQDVSASLPFYFTRSSVHTFAAVAA